MRLMHAISSHIRRVARGKHGAEHLNRQEACEVFAHLLDEVADPLQIGAFLIAERMKGETAEEIAGFVDAARTWSIGYGDVRAPAGCVDLPCYAGKRRAAPVHLAAALQARDAGIPVFVHGVSHIEGRLSAWQALEAAGVQRAGSLADAQAILAHDGIVYADLAELCPPLLRIYNLRPRLGVRSFANTVARLLNPLGCAGQLNGFFHTPYADKMAGANVLLGQPRSLIFMGAEGDPELYAERQKVVAMQTGGDIAMLDLPDCGCDSYPKEKGEPEAVAARFAAILAGQLDPQRDAREVATLDRMLAAFRWAAGGELPSDWTITER
ncbi:MAG TPA: anthranilate phosphoribosyltransferase [Mariprofundaceae bacterium]|nr:anthranilate phosphoribosyltransferase [Mariprofundaceae bacterium]